jgi:hypothetical protein
MSKLVIKEPVFGTILHVVIGDARDYVKAYRRFWEEDLPIDLAERYGGELTYACRGDLVTSDTFLMYIDQTNQFEDILAHETAHLIDRIFQRNSVPPGPESTELRAALTAYYQKEIRNAYKNKRVKRGSVHSKGQARRDGRAGVRQEGAVRA